MNQPPSTNNAAVTRAARLRALLKLHRRAGVISAVFVIILSLSGIVLHHSARLGLDRQFLSSASLLAWYDIEVPAPGNHFALDSHSVTHIADALYFDTVRIPGSFAAPRGLVAIESAYVVALPDALVLLTPTGQVIESLTSVHGVPVPIRQIGVGPDARMYLRVAAGVIRADVDSPLFLTQDLAPAGIDWSQATAPAAPLLEAIRRDYAGSLLTWERLVLDIHSGRLLGSLGLVLVDVMALLFVFMAVTGIWIWSRRRP